MPFRVRKHEKAPLQRREKHPSEENEMQCPYNLPYNMTPRAGFPKVAATKHFDKNLNLPLKPCLHSKHII